MQVLYIESPLVYLSVIESQWWMRMRYVIVVT
jgi:hypothetical protein